MTFACQDHIFFFKQKTAYEMLRSLVGSEMCIRDRSLILTAASVVITFLCTRRCYDKKSSPPSPNEKSVYYETVQSDSVQMQPSPAYQSVEQLK